MQQLLIYTPLSHSRMDYTFRVMFDYLLKVNFTITSDKNTYLQSTGPKINYSQQKLDTKELFIPAGNLLFENGLHHSEVKVFQWDALPAFFQISLPKTDLPFDLPAAIFYLLSRYEEYLPNIKDQHHRFPANASLAFRNNFLHRPLVNEWMIWLRQALNHRFPQLDIPMPTYQFQPSFDIDFAWAYLHKKWYLSLGGISRSFLRGQFTDLQARWNVFTQKAADPFDVYPYLKRFHQEDSLQPLFFFLLGDMGKYDRSISIKVPAFRELILETAAHFDVGIHPSYNSNGSKGQLEREVKRLHAITRQPVTLSRQHFLKLEFPNTYQNLIQIGIQADYTMGYAAQPGFRASVATPYPWYDLDKETSTELMIHPFQVMDVTLKEYLKLKPEEAIDRVKPLLQITKEVGGIFCTLWHNSSFSFINDWEPWKWVYEEMVRLARN